MTKRKERVCPDCGGVAKRYDRVNRTVRTKNGETKSIKVERYKCVKCGKIHRELPSYILPYKHYESEVVQGVLEGLITSETLGYEDYPCEMTMSRWIKESK